jgi:hypothetical protein
LEELQFEYNLQENVALVCVGGETQVVQHFTNDYSLIRQATGKFMKVLTILNDKHFISTC